MLQWGYKQKDKSESESLRVKTSPPSLRVYNRKLLQVITGAESKATGGAVITRPPASVLVRARNKVARVLIPKTPCINNLSQL